MDDDRLQTLERLLLTKPLDAELRLDYADSLFAADRVEEAAAQYSLLMQSLSDDARPRVGAARCALRMGDREAAVEHYVEARNLAHFGRDVELETLLANAQARGPHLSVVAGSAEIVRLPARAAITFADVAGMSELKKVLRLQIIEPFRNPGLFQRFRKKAGGGVLLYGPPGCGKTLMAKAIAGECSAEFCSVGISDVLNMWIGESERNLALIFEQARARQPCVLFFDELDALAFSRSKSGSAGARTVVNEFLAQLDGFNEGNEGVMVLGATNMPWDVDPAIKRPGRFSRQVFVPPPDIEARAEMLRMKLAGIPHEEPDIGSIAERADLYSGADIDGLVDLAKEQVLSEILEGGAERGLRTSDLLVALEAMTPSTVDWLRTARNLVKFSGADSSYRDVEKYLKRVKRL